MTNFQLGKHTRRFARGVILFGTTLVVCAFFAAFAAPLLSTTSKMFWIVLGAAAVFSLGAYGTGWLHEQWEARNE